MHNLAPTYPLGVGNVFKAGSLALPVAMVVQDWWEYPKTGILIEPDIQYQ